MALLREGSCDAVWLDELSLTWHVAAFPLSRFGDVKVMCYRAAVKDTGCKLFWDLGKLVEECIGQNEVPKCPKLSKQMHRRWNRFLNSHGFEAAQHIQRASPSDERAFPFVGASTRATMILLALLSRRRERAEADGVLGTFFRELGGAGSFALRLVVHRDSSLNVVSREYEVVDGFIDIDKLATCDCKEYRSIAALRAAVGGSRMPLPTFIIHLLDFPTCVLMLALAVGVLSDRFERYFMGHPAATSTLPMCRVGSVPPVADLSGARAARARNPATGRFRKVAGRQMRKSRLGQKTVCKLRDVKRYWMASRRSFDGCVRVAAVLDATTLGKKTRLQVALMNLRSGIACLAPPQVRV